MCRTLTLRDDEIDLAVWRDGDAPSAACDRGDEGRGMLDDGRVSSQPVGGILSQRGTRRRGLSRHRRYRREHADEGEHRNGGEDEGSHDHESLLSDHRSSCVRTKKAMSQRPDRCVRGGSRVRLCFYRRGPSAGTVMLRNKVPSMRLTQSDERWGVTVA